ncbi:MAG: hypothetical protein LIO70_00755 [Clostridiales bacterium]|nr:hypothetical protein [Clostridiales bacterium]
MNRLKTILCMLLSILMAAFLIVAFYRDSRLAQAQADAIAEVLAEAQPYEQELEAIESELEEMAAAVPYVSETARFVIAFELSAVSDLSYIREVAETYQFTPVLVLDCTDDLETLEGYLEAAADTGWEIMLFANSFSAEVNEDVLAVRDALEQRGMEDTGVFLLRTDYATTENIQLLLEDGFIGYTVYNETPLAGYARDDEESVIYFDYSYMQTVNETINSRLALTYANKCVMLTLFDLERVWNGPMSESYVASILELVQTYAGYDDACVSTIAEVAAELNEAQEAEAERQQAYDEYAAQQQERIDELNELIDGIYSKLSNAF